MMTVQQSRDGVDLVAIELVQEQLMFCLQRLAASGTLSAGMRLVAHLRNVRGRPPWWVWRDAKFSSSVSGVDIDEAGGLVCSPRFRAAVKAAAAAHKGRGVLAQHGIPVPVQRDWWEEWRTAADEDLQALACDVSDADLQACYRLKVNPLPALRCTHDKYTWEYVGAPPPICGRVVCCDSGFVCAQRIISVEGGFVRASRKMQAPQLDEVVGRLTGADPNIQNMPR